MKELNPKQLRFCQEYVIDLNGTQAAIRAGYSKKTAEQQASRMLLIVKVQEKIAELQKSVSETLNLDAQWVLQRFKEISDRCMTAEPVMINVGGQWVESGEYQFDSSGANKATENIGKHIGFYSEDNNQKRTILRVGFDA